MLFSTADKVNIRNTLSRTRIILNVYDVTSLNCCLHPLGLGLYHSGVQVEEDQWMYCVQEGQDDGLKVIDPLSYPLPIREQVEFGDVLLSPAQLYRKLELLRNEFRVSRYNLLSKNCNHFSARLLGLLAAEQAPPQLTRCTRCLECCTSCIPPALLSGRWWAEGQGQWQVETDKQ